MLSFIRNMPALTALTTRDDATLIESLAEQTSLLAFRTTVETILVAQPPIGAAHRTEEMPSRLLDIQQAAIDASRAANQTLALAGQQSHRPKDLAQDLDCDVWTFLEPKAA